MKMVRCTFVFLAIFSFALFALWEDCPRQLLNIDEILKQAEAIDLAKYPNANYVVISDVNRIDYNAEGQYFQVNDFAVKILTEKGRDDQRNQQLYYSRSYSADAFELIRVYKADGRVIDVDLVTKVSDQVESSQMGSNIYDPNHRVMNAVVSDLEVGDVLRVVYNEELKIAPIPNSFYTIGFLQSTEPICHASFEIHGPISLPLRTKAIKNKVINDVAATVSQSDGQNHYKWEVKDVPQLIQEPEMPSLMRSLQRVLVSTFSGWDEVASWYWTLCEKHFGSNEAMAEKVKSLIQGKNSDMEKIQAIFKFVSQEVRYMGVTVETEAPGFEPHDAIMTFENRHGVCRDKAALLAAMLRLAGFDASTVLISAGTRLDAEVPVPYFNHAITSVRNADGSDILMDCTNESTADLLPKYLANNSYLVARTGSETLRVTPVCPASENQTTITTEGKMDEHGKAIFTSKIRFSGIADNKMRKTLLRMTPDERHDLLRRCLTAVNPTAKLIRYEIIPQDLQDTSTPVMYVLQYSMDDLMINDSEELDKAGTAVFIPPLLSRVMGRAETLLNSWNTGLDSRQYILSIWTTGANVEDMVLDIPYEYSHALALPKYEVVDDGKLHWEMIVKVEDGKIKIHREYAVNALEWTPAEYAALKSQRAVIERMGDKRLILERQVAVKAVQELAEPEVKTDFDTEILDYKVDFDLWDDPGCWTTTTTMRRMILTYNGVKDNGEMRWHFNPSTSEVNLEYARVINGDQVKEISAAEINLMDEEWVAKAPRYPAGKILVASLPGVQVGSIIEYKVVRHNFSRFNFALEESRLSADPIRSAEISVIADAGRKLDIALFRQGLQNYGEPNLDISEEKLELPGNRVKYVWNFHELPGYFWENQMLPDEFWKPTVFVSEGKWKDYCRQIQAKFDSYSADGQNMEALLGMVQAAPADKQLETLTQLVEHMVQYVPINFYDMSFNCMTSPEQTLADGYASETDKALVYYVAAKRLGYRPEICLVYPQGAYDGFMTKAKKFVNPKYFSQIRLRVKKYNGHDVWLNDCSQYGDINCCGFNNFTILNVAASKIEKVKLLPEYSAPSDEHYIIEVKEDGSAIVTVKKQIYGQSCEGYRQYYKEATPEELRRDYQTMIAGYSASAVPVTPERIVNLDSYPITEEFTIKIADFAVTDGDYMYFKLPFSIYLGNYPDERHNILYKVGRHFCNRTLNLRLPSKFDNIVMCPPEIDWKSPNGSGFVKVEYLNDPEDYAGEMRMSFQWDWPTEAVTLDKYPLVQEIQQKVGSPSSSYFLLQRHIRK